MAPARRNSPRRRTSLTATPHVDLEYPSSVPTFTVNPTQFSSSSTINGAPQPWFSAFGRADNEAPLPNAIDPKYSDPAYYASSSAYGKNGRNSSHTAKKPAGHIKRPPNCFLLFRSHVKESNIRIPDELKPLIKQRLSEKKKQDRQKNGHGAGGESESDDDDENDDDEQSVSKISGILWDFLPPKEKSFFRARAAHAKAQHKQLFPDYKYSPQVKDKNAKKRVGKKMAADKKQRLEEVAGVLVQNLGWVKQEQPGTPSTPASSVKQEGGFPLPPFHHQHQHQQSITDVPGTGAFAIPQYEHQQPPTFFGGPGLGKPRSVPSTPDPMYGVPMSLGQPSSSSSATGHMQHNYAFPAAGGGGGGPMSAFPYDTAAHVPQPSDPRMQRRTSSCPPANAHLTWGATGASSSSSSAATDLPLPHAYGYQPTATANGWTNNNPGGYSNNQTGFEVAYPAAQSSQHQQHQHQQVNGVYVRPGGKTLRKMRTGAPTAKSQLLNGKKTGGGGGSGGGSRKHAQSEGPSSTGGPAMMLPSLPTVMKNIAPSPSQLKQQQELMSTMVPMSTTTPGMQQQDEMVGWNAFANYDLMAPNSQHSSPATFSTSTAASVLETPPVGHQLPQLAYAHNFTGALDDASALTPKANEESLGLTIVDPEYTFPPPGPRAASPSKRSTSNKWNKPQSVKSPYSTSGRKVPRLQVAAASAASDVESSSSPYLPQSAFPVTPNNSTAPSLVSPTPVHAIPMFGGIHQQQQSMGMDPNDLGVELNLNLPPGTDVGQMDPEHLGGLLEYAFPQQGVEYMGGLLQDGYSFGADGSNSLLGDVALGVEPEQPQYHGGAATGYENVSPLDVAIDPALYEAGQFDPNMFVNDPNMPHPLPVAGGVEEEVNLSAATAEEMAASNNLEFQMMEWRRSSGSGQGQGQGPNMNRRASVSTGPSLYGFQGYDQQDAATPKANYEIQPPHADAQQQHQQQLQGGMNMNVGWEFEFEQQQLPDFSNAAHQQHPDPAGYYGQQQAYPGANFYGNAGFYPATAPPAPHQQQVNLETVQERSSSEEADEPRYHENWVSSSA